MVRSRAGLFYLVAGFACRPSGGPIPSSNEPTCPGGAGCPVEEEPGGTPPDPLEGSYDLVFDKVVVSQMEEWSSPSQGRRVRLDVRKREGAYDAVFTGRWEQPAAFAVSVDAERVTLSGGPGKIAFGGTTDGWTQLVMARDVEGRFAGAVQGRGDLHFDGGDVFFQSEIAGEGTVGGDTTAPELRAALVSSRVSPGPLFPWDPLVIEVAEPVDPAAVIPRASLATSGGDVAPEVAWAPPPADSTRDWAGVVAVTGRLVQWDIAADPYTLEVAGGVPDRAGHAAAALSAPVTFVPLGPALASHHFDGAGMTVSFWGDVAILAVGTTDASALCEEHGCLAIGPFDTICATTAQGIAGRLTAAGATLLNIRYRVLSESDRFDPDAPPSEATALTVQVARPAEAAATSHVDVQPYLELDEPVGDLRWATDWDTAQIAVAASDAELGFAFHGGRKVRCIGRIPQGPRMAVYVDRVWAD